MIKALIIVGITVVVLIISTFLFSSFNIKNKRISTYWIITVIGAISMIVFGVITIDDVAKGLTSSNSINPLKILCIFFSMTFLSIFEDEMGLFSFLASKASKIAKSSQFVLFFVIYLLVSVLTIFTSNDVVILTFTPFICYFAKHTKINPIPYLVMEFAASNTWSMLFIIGNPTNIYLASSANVDFVSYFLTMLVPTLFASLVEIILLFLLFRKTLKQPMTRNDEETANINDKMGLFIGLFVLLSCIIMLALSSYLNLEMWIICLCAVAILLITILIKSILTKDKPVYLLHVTKRLPIQLIPFVIGMFILVLGLFKVGFTSTLADFLNSGYPIISYGFSSLLGTNLLNNIPMSVLYSFVLNNSGGVSFYQSLYSTIISSNIGAFLTPLGALAGIMFLDLTKKQNIKYSFKEFSFYGLIIAFPTLVSTFLGLYLVCH